MKSSWIYLTRLILNTTGSRWKIFGDSSINLMNIDIDSITLLSISSNSSTNKDEARLQNGQYNDFRLEQNIPTENSMRNGEKALGQATHPTDLISNNAHDLLVFYIIPESTHRMPLTSGSF
ncbi:hypothetical protein GGP41_008383 [Bipolaris sorokiniana]|uniref:Uncharacterized protein n=1 Tax=Cochliobolus sativus TaxID=45130 RepID=A0A8H5ZDI5_COCSA|nr:hypothetical protein GGP41_008383 [Bipolaris sorokiniana]